MRALIVDDDEFSLDMLQNAMDALGYDVMTARNGREALQCVRDHPVRLVITDWEMPEMAGDEFCRQVRREDVDGYVYVIILTGRDHPEQKIIGLEAGADDLLTKPFNPAELTVRLKVAERILALETRDVALFALAKLAESRDPETGAHLERVQSYARLLTQTLATRPRYGRLITNEYVRLIYQTSPLHDIGKVGIPDAILLKPGKLDAEEFAIMKTHTALGAATLSAALDRFPSAGFLQLGRDIALTHHERFNGQGYPRGLAGENIPLCGRIVAVADVYDALTSKRVYKEAIPHPEARQIILSESGEHFDPEVVAAFVASEGEFLKIYARLANEAEEHPARLASKRKVA